MWCGSLKQCTNTSCSTFRLTEWSPSKHPVYGILSAYSVFLQTFDIFILELNSVKTWWNLLASTKSHKSSCQHQNLVKVWIYATVEITVLLTYNHVMMVTRLSIVLLTSGVCILDFSSLNLVLGKNNQSYGLDLNIGSRTSTFSRLTSLTRLGVKTLHHNYYIWAFSF